MSKRSKRVLIAVVSLVALVVLWFQFVGIYVDFQWYGEVGFRDVFTVQAISRVVLFLVAGIGAAGLVFLSLMFAYRSRPVFVPSGPNEDPLAPYRTMISTRPRLIAIGVSALIGIVCGLSAQGRWETVQLFLNGGDFGQTDPQFGHDVGFYVFRLPLIEMLLGWLFVITAICFVAVLVVQYIYGGIRLQGSGRKVTSAATLQLSLLIGAFVLIKAVQYWFDRYSLLFSDRSGIFTGASYTDVNAVLPAKIILMVIAAICAGGFIVGAIMRSVKLPAIALALLVLSSVLIGGVWPLILQSVVVNPNAISKEPAYIDRNIQATRDAYGIGDDVVSYTDYTDQGSADPAELAQNDSTVPNARLLDPNLLSDTFTQRQQLENFYGFPDQLAVDRYEIDGKMQDYVVAAREIDARRLTAGQRDWIQQHFIYTHGNGFVAAPANRVADGYPVFTVSDVANQGDIKVDQPRIYYGELTSDYAIVGQVPGGEDKEYDTSNERYTYTGAGGISVGNLFQRLVFATNYGEANFLFSGEINDNSKIMYNRDPRERVEKAAPFLTVDTKPYPAVVNKRIVWIVDAYTTAANYPYAENTQLAEATRNSQSEIGATATQKDAQVSYIRNSVKATVDAYDGTVTLYRFDEEKTDPVLEAWNQVFPGLLTPSDQISDELRSHFRYPEDLFEVQRSLLTKYHVDSPVDFFNVSNFWKEPNDPTESSVQAAQPPYYLQVETPGSDGAAFQLTSALTGYDREFISAYIAANSDPEDYGKITVQEFPTEQQTPGPVLVQQLFNADPDISEWVTLRNRAGTSQVEYGNLLTLPTEEGLLYVEPLYIKGVSENAYPQLGQVLVWFSNRVGMGSTLSDALENAASKKEVVIDDSGSVEGGDGPAISTQEPGSTPDQTGSADAGTDPTTDSSTPTTSESDDVTVLPPDEAAAREALDEAYQKLEDAKKSGDQAEIGAANKALEQAVAAYLELSAGGGGDASGSGTGQSSQATATGGG